MEKVLIFVTATALAAAAWASPPKYKFVEAWGKQGSGNGEFVNPMDVSLASNGNFYVADMGNNRVQYFTSTGSFLGKWPVGGLYPNGIYVASNGNVYVTLYQSHCVMYYTSAGSFLGKWGENGEGNGEFVVPSYLDMSADGKRVYVTEEMNNRVQYFKKRD